VCTNLSFPGLELDQKANESCQPDADIASPDAAARILVIGTREDLTIMRETRRMLASPIGLPHGNEPNSYLSDSTVDFRSAQSGPY
jgi:hypothetical protein